MVAGGIRLPNSCVRILGVLNNRSNGFSQQQLISETGLSERAVKYALKELKRLQLVSELTLILDLRRKVFSLKGAICIGGDGNGNK